MRLATKLFLLGFAATTRLTVASPAPLQTDERETRGPLEILHPPAGIQTRMLFYRPTQYLHIEEFNIHVFGTETVTPWMMRNSCELIRHIVGALKNPEDRKKFSGFEAFLITDADPDLTGHGGRKGHRNTGGKGVSLFNEVLVCATAVDTIRPDNPPVYRAWNTPVHEFGHAIEHTLGLRDKSDEVFKTHIPHYDPKVRGEYFAWAAQKWFKSDPKGNGRKAMPKWEYEYLATIFSAEDEWCPSRDPRPQPAEDMFNQIETEADTTETTPGR